MNNSGSTSPRLSEVRLVCHCLAAQACHADCTTLQYKLMYPQADDRENHRGMVHSSEVLNRLAQLRLEPDSEVESVQEAHYEWDRGVRVATSATAKLSRPLDAGQWTIVAIRKTHVGQPSPRSVWISLAAL